MFYDKDSMLEMFELSVGKRKWKHVLVTSEMGGEQFYQMTTKEIHHLHHDWKTAIKAVIDPHDAAYVINQGNIFCLVHENNIRTFEEQVRAITLPSQKVEGCLGTSLLYLSNKETEFLLKMS